MIRKLTIRGFKSIAEAELDLGKLNVFVGANGAGKSAVLEALGYLGVAVSGAVSQESVHWRGLRYGDPDQVVCALDGFGDGATEIAVVNDEAGYRVGLGDLRTGTRSPWHYIKENIDHRGQEWLDRDSRRVQMDRGDHGMMPLEVSPPESFAGFGPLVRALPAPAPIHQLLVLAREFSVYAFSTPFLRGRGDDPWRRDPIGLGGSQLSEALGNFGDAHRRELVRDVLCELVDWVDDVYGKGEPFQGDSLGGFSGNVNVSEVTFRDRHMRKDRNLITGTESSEGALHVLAALVALLHPDTPKCFAIDNIDTALNPLLARALVRRFQDLLKDEASDRQVLVTAHNPAVLDGLRLSDPDVRLFTVSRLTNGETTVKRIELENLGIEQQEHSLSDLWLSGVLGGMPAACSA